MRATPFAVYFWGGPLSQWFKAPFRAQLEAATGDNTFHCSEQFLMAAKARLFGDDEAFERIMRSGNAKRIKALGREVRGFDAAAWNDAVPELLVRGNLAKFAQNAELLAYLRSTTGKRLVEGSPVDRIYGVGLAFDDPLIEDEANWLGRNLLGNALETVRSRLA